MNATRPASGNVGMSTRMSALVLLCLLVSGAGAGGVQAASPDSPVHDAASDPFVAGALGLFPFVSGLYLSDRPARGILFTAVDVILVMGMYTARNSPSGDPANVKGYFILMGANNLADAFLSSWYARHPAGPRLNLMNLPGPRGTEGEGLGASLHWNF